MIHAKVQDHKTSGYEDLLKVGTIYGHRASLVM